LYVPLYGGKGLMLGWMTFREGATDDLTGAVRWIKPTKPAHKFYAGGFTNESVVVGSRYDSNQVGQLSGAVVVVGEANLSGVWTNAVQWATGAGAGSGGSVSLALEPVTGLWGGVYADPVTGVAHKLRGVLLQKLQGGAGYLKGTNQLGWAVLRYEAPLP